MRPKKVLVANRGEVACRILRGLRAAEVASVAVYTPPDAQALHPTLADEAVALAAPGDYLEVEAILHAAREVGATAVHPGYGFLSQSVPFAAACAAAGLTFIGPSAACMAQVGDKRAARKLAQSLGVPVVPGAEDVADAAAVHAFAAEHGFPLLVKAAAAGGGRGLRRVDDAGGINEAVAAARREAVASVGDARLLVERWLVDVRHVEVQVLGDGRVARAIGDRDCSLQRRFQKVVEEGPAPGLSDGVRAGLWRAAETLLAAAGYLGAGTVEFLLDGAGATYFLEVNPRLQVEHPVTELTCGLDVVALQVALAHGSLQLDDFVVPAPRGHAVEVRLNAEDPARDFVPCTGTVRLLQWPQGPGLRIDAGVAEGSVVGAHYDSLLAKLLAWGPDRPTAIRRLVAALDELVLLGVGHNQAYLRQLLTDAAFIGGTMHTQTLSGIAFAPPAPPPAALVAELQAALAPPVAGPAACAASPSAWQTLRGWRNG